MSHNANESHRAAAAPANPLICAVEMIEIARMIRVREVRAKWQRARTARFQDEAARLASRAGEDLQGGLNQDEFYPLCNCLKHIPFSV